MESPWRIAPLAYYAHSGDPVYSDSVSITDDGSGTLRGTKQFEIVNNGDRALAANLDVLPVERQIPEWLSNEPVQIVEVSEGPQPYEWRRPLIEWFTIETPQLGIPAGQPRVATIGLAVPSVRCFTPYRFQLQVRSPGLPPALSQPVGFARRLPLNWEVNHEPGSVLNMTTGQRKIVFRFRCPGFALEGGWSFRLDIGAPDEESASWFRYQESVDIWPGHGLPPSNLALAPEWSGRVEFDVTVDEAALRSDRRSVGLRPVLYGRPSPLAVGADWTAPPWVPVVEWPAYNVMIRY